MADNRTRIGLAQFDLRPSQFFGRHLVRPKRPVEDELVALVLGVAQGRVGKAEVAVFLKKHVGRSG